MNGRGDKWTIGLVVAAVVVTCGVAGWMLLRDDGPSEDERALCEALDRPMPPWQVRSDVIVFLDAGLDQARIDEIGAELREVDGLDAMTYVDQDAALAEFTEMFESRPDVTAGVFAGVLPTSYRFERTPGAAPDLARIESMPDVHQVMAGLGPGTATVDVLRTVAEAGYLPGTGDGVGSVVGDRLTAEVPERLKGAAELLAGELGVGSGADSYARVERQVAAAAQDVLEFHETTCS